MSAADAAVVAAALSTAAALGAIVAAVVVSRRARDLRQLVEQLRTEAVPLVHQARVVVDHAATEMERVGDVLGSAEAVTATVDSASRLAYRAFANPVVRVLAFGSGAGSALRRLVGRAPRTRPVRRAPAPAVLSTQAHRRPRRRRRELVG